jgi:hypothetical protein
LNGWAVDAREIDAGQAATLAAAAERQAAALLRNTLLPWQRWIRFSVRGRSMTFWPVMGAAALGGRGRGFFWLTIFDSKRP